MNSTLQIIAVLLFLILCVMLNGAEEVKSYLASLSIWFGGFFLLYVVYKVVALLLGEMNYDAKNRSSQGEPWLYRYPLALGIGGFVLVWLAAFIVAGTVHNPGFAKAMDGLPLEMAPAWLLSISAVTFVLESLWLLIFPQRKEAHLLGQLRDGRTLTSAQTKWLAKRQKSKPVGNPQRSTELR